MVASIEKPLEHDSLIPSEEAAKPDVLISQVLPYYYDLPSGQVMWHLGVSADHGLMLIEGEGTVKKTLSSEANLHMVFNEEPIAQTQIYRQNISDVHALGSKKNTTLVDITLLAAQVWSSDNPHPVKQNCGGVTGIITVNSNDLKRVLNGEYIVINGLPYKASENLTNQLAYKQNESNFTDLTVSFVESIDSKFRTYDLEESYDYFASIAAEYLRQYSADPDLLMPHLMYVLFGNQNQWNLKDVLESGMLYRIASRIDTHNDIEIQASFERISDYIRTLYSLFGEVEHDDIISDRDAAKSLVAKGLLDNEYRLLEMKQFTNSFMSAISDAMTHRGARKSDLHISNEILNAPLSTLWHIIFSGTLYGVQIDTLIRSRLIQEASMFLGMCFSAYPVYKEYLEKLAIGDSTIDRLFNKHDIFVPLNKQTELGNLRPRLRKYSFETPDGNVDIECIVDEAETKSFISFWRSRLSGKKFNELNDVFRRSVIVVTIIKPDGNTINPMENYTEAIPYIQKMFDDLSKRIKQMKLKLSDSTLIASDDRIKNRLRSNHNIKEAKQGSIDRKFRQIKFYVYSEDSKEVSEVALWGLKDSINAQDWGYLRKKKDDVDYHFWRLEWLLGIFFPDALYPVHATQTIFERANTGRDD